VTNVGKGTNKGEILVDDVTLDVDEVDEIKLVELPGLDEEIELAEVDDVNKLVEVDVSEETEGWGSCDDEEGADDGIN